jgi:hypothetical protein
MELREILIIARSWGDHVRCCDELDAHEKKVLAEIRRLIDRRDKMDQSDQSDLEEIVADWFSAHQYGYVRPIAQLRAKSLVKYILDKQYEAKVRQERRATGWCQLCEDGVKHAHKRDDHL